jgi:hypothetical protein
MKADYFMNITKEKSSFFFKANSFLNSSKVLERSSIITYLTWHGA